MVDIAEHTTPGDWSDAEVDTATRQVIDAVVALQNLIAKKDAA